MPQYYTMICIVYNTHMSSIFDGKEFSQEKEKQLQIKVQELKRLGVSLRAKTFTFQEDEGSRLYTKLKAASATRVGISYEPEEFSLSDDLGMVVQTIREASVDSALSGIMIQKPSKMVWANITGKSSDQFQAWWEELTNAIDPKKDVDGLTLHSQVLPATVKACLSILDEAKTVLNLSDDEWKQKRILVIGRSDIVGKPLTQVLRKAGYKVENIGQQEFPKTAIDTFDVVISAVGIPNLVTGVMIKEGAIVIDVGSPQGDVDRISVEPKAAFLTPVPGGVGPVTVISLMENIVTIAQDYGRSR